MKIKDNFFLFPFLILVYSNAFTFGESLFNEKYNHTYSYEATLTSEADSPETQLSLRGQLQIHPISKMVYTVKILHALTNNQTSPTVLDDLKLPFSIHTENREVRIKFDPTDSLASRNLKRGIVSLLNVDYQKEKTRYNVAQESPRGLCSYEYSVDKNKKPDNDSQLLIVRRRVDSTCQSTVNDDIIYADKVLMCHQAFNATSTKEYFYDLEETHEDVYIKRADSKEIAAIRFGVYENVTHKLISTQSLRLLNRVLQIEESKQTERKPGLLPTFGKPPFGLPRLESPLNIGKDILEKAKDMLTKGDFKSTLEAEPENQKYESNDFEIITRINRLLDTLKSMEKTDIEKLQIIPQFIELQNHLLSVKGVNLVKLYDEEGIKGDHRPKTKLFFQILTTRSDHESFEAAKEIAMKKLGEDEKKYNVDQLMTYFTSRTKKVTLDKEKALEYMDLCKEIFVDQSEPLRRACWLFASRTIGQSKDSLRTRDLNLVQKEAIITIFDGETEITKEITPTQSLLALKVVNNLGIPSGIHFIKDHLKNRELSRLVRIEAAWALNRFESSPQLEDLVFDRLNDATEEHEIRFAMFNVALRHYPKQLIPFVIRLKNNFIKDTFIDDKQLVLSIYSLLKTNAKLKEQDCNRKYVKESKELLNYIRSDFKKHLGSGSLLNSHNGIIESHDGQIRTLYAFLNSPSSLIPQTIVYEHRDTFSAHAIFIRSLHDNFLTDLIPRPRAADANHAVEDAMLKIIEKLRLRRKESQDSEYVISRTFDNYEIYFIYGDEKREIKPTANDFIAFLGNGLRVNYDIYHSSFFDSGFRYFMASTQLRFSKYSVSDDGFGIFHATGGYSTSDGLLPIANRRLASGKLVQKTLRLNVQKMIHIGSYPNVTINGHIGLLRNDEQNTTIYYESQNKFNFLYEKAIMSLHLQEFDSLNGDDYEEVNKSIASYFRIRRRQPFDKTGENRFHVSKLYSGWNTVGSLVGGNDFNYDLKLSVEPATQHRLFKYQLDTTHGEDVMNISLLLSTDDSPAVRLQFTRQNVREERKRKFSFSATNYEFNITDELNAEITYPNQQMKESEIEEVLPNIEIANITGALLSHTENTETQLTFKGVYSKRSGKRDLLEYRQTGRICTERHDVNCILQLYSNAYRYNKLELDIDLSPNATEARFTILELIAKRLFDKYKSNARIEPGFRSSDHHKGKLIVNLRNDSKKKKHTDISIIRYYGEVDYENLPAKISPFLFGSSNYEQNLDISQLMPRFRAPVCLVNSPNFITFDGYRRVTSRTDNCTKPTVLAADCKRFEFFIIQNSDKSVTVLYGHQYNVTFTAKDAYVNGEQLDSTFGVTKQFGKLKVMRKMYDNDLAQSVEIPRTLTISYHRSEVYIEASHYYKDQLCGICGDYDDNWNDDIITPQREPVELEKYTDSWSIGDCEQ